MRHHLNSIRKAALLATAAVALAAASSTAFANGFAVREQSASYLGSAFAGAAAGGDLSSSYWNPAAFGIAESGLSTQSAYSAIFADTELSNGTTNFPVGGATSTDIDKIGVLSASYAAFRFNDQVVFGISTNSPFGLATDPDDKNWVGRFHSREAEMVTFNATPTIAYEVSPGVHVAAGLQLEYMQLKLWAASPFGPASDSLKGEDTIGVGFTLGVLLKPAEGTSIGLGFRSSIEHELEGNFNGLFFGTVPFSATIETPELLTFSFSQALSNNMRLLGTAEWSNWSRIDTVRLVGLGDSINAKWDDGWFVSGGLEYDYMPGLTLRGGAGFEKSPIREPGQRLVQLPDSDRVWLSIGASYRYSEATTFDMSFAHVFFEDAHLTREGLGVAQALVLDADVENSANIVSFGMRTRW